MKKNTSAPPRWLPRLRHRKSKGEWAEIAFMSRTIGLGFTVCRPYGDNHPFDFLVVTPAGHALRLQVKSSWTMLKRAYFLNTHDSRRRCYRKADIDFLIGYVVPEDAWYIIPIRAVAKTMIGLFPHVLRSRGRFERYREAWHLLCCAPPTTDGLDLLPVPALLDM